MFEYAVLFLIVGFSIATYYKDTKKEEELPASFNKGIYTLLILTLIFSVIDIRQDSYVERQFWYQGEIQGSQIDIPAIKLGDAIFTSSELKTFFNISGDPINLWIRDGELKLYTIVRNKNGDQMVAVIGNNFVVNPNTVSDFNYDEEALEVLDNKGDVVLQIQMEDDGVLFSGKFWTDDGTRVGIGYNVIEKSDAQGNLDLTFPRIFVYPGKNNLGLRR